ncbi:hypothetical protein HDV05_007489 [Chytridiales sp. JEL 0842]|nr:hypothetical protein HDV05_007489 [Chytridiales sp. JEL 0842]
MGNDNIGDETVHYGESANDEGNPAISGQADDTIDNLDWQEDQDVEQDAADEDGGDAGGDGDRSGDESEDWIYCESLKDYIPASIYHEREVDKNKNPQEDSDDTEFQYNSQVDDYESARRRRMRLRDEHAKELAQARRMSLPEYQFQPDATKIDATEENMSNDEYLKDDEFAGASDDGDVDEGQEVELDIDDDVLLDEEEFEDNEGEGEDDYQDQEDDEGQEDDEEGSEQAAKTRSPGLLQPKPRISLGWSQKAKESSNVTDDNASVTSNADQIAKTPPQARSSRPTMLDHHKSAPGSAATSPKGNSRRSTGGLPLPLSDGAHGHNADGVNKMESVDENEEQASASAIAGGAPSESTRDEANDEAGAAGSAIRPRTSRRLAEAEGILKPEITIQAAYAKGSSSRPYNAYKMAAPIPPLLKTAEERKAFFASFQTPMEASGGPKMPMTPTASSEALPPKVSDAASMDPLPPPVSVETPIENNIDKPTSTTPTTTTATKPTPLVPNPNITLGPLSPLTLESSTLLPLAPWPPAELDALNRGLETVGKNFTRISREFVPTRSTHECIEAYYAKKHTLRYHRVKVYKKEMGKEEEEYVRYVSGVNKYVMSETKRFRSEKPLSAIAGSGYGHSGGVRTRGASLDAQQEHLGRGARLRNRERVNMAED